MAFITYIRPVVTQPTLQEIIAALSGAQKTGLLNAYAQGATVDQVKHVLPIPKAAISALFDEITEIRDLSAAYMREEILLEEEVLDPETGEVITPAVYNDQPADLVELKALVSTELDEVFTEAQVGAVIDKMIEYTEIDADGNYIGTWSVYASEVIK